MAIYKFTARKSQSTFLSLPPALTVVPHNSSMLLPLLALSTYLTILLAYAQPGPVQTFFPASIPLAIRSPYLNTWQLSTNSSPSLAASWSVFWGQDVRALFSVLRFIELM